MYNNAVKEKEQARKKEEQERKAKEQARKKEEQILKTAITAFYMNNYTPQQIAGMLEVELQTVHNVIEQYNKAKD